MSTHDDELDQPTTKFSADQYDNSGFSATGAAGQTTSLTPPRELEPDEDQNRWHGGLDFGLLVLRLLLGGTMIAHGLQKFGLFDGPGLGGFADALTGLGYTSQTTLLSWMTALAEVGGGALLVLGLFTPLGAAAVLGVTVNIIFVKFEAGGRFFTGDGGGFEYELVLAGLAFALLFTGAGRASLDKNTPWRQRPFAFGLVGFLLAGAASGVVIALFR
ncbi:DoxX family protein [Prauserella cavernicola]|uniref:DoxX family protein n=1 Tax=Prauserella cavernicola TaxID=2800127 RepID=A0A934V749_9PSEU|nr:DoxX family protein [Prauserella cavernicola]MBK1786880.1 DoxX family protein [Prauserella cavernicola]